jgi:hypothetical protein
VVDEFENYKMDKYWWAGVYFMFAEVKSQDPERWPSFCEEFIYHFYEVGPPSLRNKKGKPKFNHE